MEGTSREYAPIEYPAVPDYQVLTALTAAAERLGKSWKAGVVQCKDSFYGQHSPGRMPVSYELEQKWEAWKRLGVLASEMESAEISLLICPCLYGTEMNRESEVVEKVFRQAESPAPADGRRRALIFAQVLRFYGLGQTPRWPSIRPAI